MHKRIAAVITAALIGTYAFVADAVTPAIPAAPVAASKALPPLPSDCRRVAVADRTLCRAVYRQHAYGWTTPTGDPQTWVPKGPALVKEITHQGLTKREMHDYLAGEQLNYRDMVVDISFSMDAIVKHCGHTRGYGAVQYIRGRDGHLYTWKMVGCD